MTLGTNGFRHQMHRRGKLPPRLPMIMREYNFVGEERHPFKGVGTVGIGAADQFVLAVGEPHEFGLTELANQFRAIA